MHTTRWTALQHGEIDCAPQPAPWNFLAEREGYRLIGEVNDVIPEIVFAALIAERAAGPRSTAHTVERLVAALREAHDVVNDPRNDDVTAPDLPADHHTRRAGAGGAGPGLHAGHGYVAGRSSWSPVRRCRPRST